MIIAYQIMKISTFINTDSWYCWKLRIHKWPEYLSY